MSFYTKVNGKCLSTCKAIRYNYARSKSCITLEMSFGFTVINSSTFIKKNIAWRKNEMARACDKFNPIFEMNDKRNVTIYRLTW